MATGCADTGVWARTTVMSAIGRYQHVNFFSTLATNDGSAVLTNDNGPWQLNALEFDFKIFVCSPTGITKYGVFCMQLAAGLVVTSAFHKRKGIPSMAIGGANTPMWACTSVVPAIRCSYDLDVSSDQAANNCFIVFANGHGNEVVCSKEKD